MPPTATSGQFVNARSYYDHVAAKYERRSSQGWLARLRTSERQVVAQFLDPRAGDRILDAGCGAGVDAVRLMRLGCLVRGIDASTRMVEEARRRGVHASVGDLAHVALAERFGKIMCCGALEFCASPAEVLRNFARHLVPGGTLVLLFPRQTLVGRAYQVFHWTHGVQASLFNTKQLTSMLDEAGFRVQQVRHPTAFTSVIAANLVSEPFRESRDGGRALLTSSDATT